MVRNFHIVLIKHLVETIIATYHPYRQENYGKARSFIKILVDQLEGQSRLRPTVKAIKKIPLDSVPNSIKLSVARRSHYAGTKADGYLLK